MTEKKEKPYLTVILIEAGIITLIDETGDIVQYRQRGMEHISDEQKTLLISMGLLQRYWHNYPELPSDTFIAYEDDDIFGNAKSAYPIEVIEAFQLTPKLSKKYFGKPLNSI